MLGSRRGFGAGDRGVSILEVLPAAFGEQRNDPPHRREGGLRAWLGWGTGQGMRGRGEIQEPWKRKTWGALQVCLDARQSLSYHLDLLPPAWRTRPNLLLHPELPPFPSTMLSTSPDEGLSWGGKEATGGVQTRQGCLAHQAPQGTSGTLRLPPPSW